MPNSTHTPSTTTQHTVDRSFQKQLRLRKRKQFLYVQQKGNRIYASHCFAYVTKHKAGHVRLGITVSKKVGKAHQRNRIKRLIREAFRHSSLRDAKGFDLVVVAKKENPPQNLSLMVKDLNHLHTYAMKSHKWKPKHQLKSKVSVPQSSKNSSST